MPLSSMTGFARADGAGDAYRWTWELRSVNGKGLDIRLRLPAGFEHLEIPARERLGARLSRGNVQAALTAQSQAGATRIRINDEVLAEVVKAMERIAGRIDVQPPTLDGILSVRGVVETIEVVEDEAVRAALAAGILADLDAALADLAADRLREGAAIAAVLQNRLDEIERLVRAVEASPARTPDAIRARLAEQVAALLGAAPALDPDRLHQEAVLLAARADVREEIDRLDAHLAAARALLAEGGPVGRRLDFLAQEFNREVNTICSKSNDRAVTALGLELKAAVDQFREQVQNLE
ncbi:MAG: YicC family protein [Bauldia sp.]|nr:YicC family protein [Bauldia sp.]